MPEKKPQSLANHVRLHPLFHFFLAPLASGLAIWQGVRLARHPSVNALFLFLLALTLGITVFVARIYALKVQDRVIRLEERLRLQMLLAGDAGCASALTESQLIALRFASDAEVPALAERAVNERLSNKQIKQAVREWRPDYWRV